MGYGIVVLDPSDDCPASHLADEHIQAEFSDANAVQKLAAASSALTFEFENVDPAVMEGLESFPSLEPLFVSRNRWREKSLARKLGIATAPFFPVNSVTDLRMACANPEIQACGGAILKTCEGGYDGKGQWRLKPEQLEAAAGPLSDSDFVGLLESDLRDLLSATTGPPAASQRSESERAPGNAPVLTAGTSEVVADSAPFLLEGMVDFSLEFSIVGTGFSDGSFHCYPPIENQHRDGILHKSLSSSNLDEVASRRAVEYARSLSEHFGYIGTFAVEFFLAEGEPVFNEMAPRPHNSGHLTMDAKLSSQFEQHIRAICGLPPGPNSSLCEAAMINLLGEDNSQLRGLEDAIGIPGLRFHWYGKKEARSGRKMGHITAIHSDLSEAERAVEKAFQCLGWVRQ